MKLTKIILIIISLIWTVINLYSAINSPNVVNFTSFTGIIPIAAGLYSEIDWIYITWNKIRAYFFLKTVNFTAKSYKYIEIEEDNFIAQLETDIKKLLDYDNYIINEPFTKRTHEDLYFTIENSSGVCSNLTINIKQDHNGQCLTIKCDYQIAYKDVAESWKSFLKLRNDFFAKFAQAENSKERYDVTIKTDKIKKYSPFYRLTVRHIGKVKINRFDLKFSDENLKVVTNLNKIYGTSDNYQDIEKLIKEYIPLSKLS